GRAARGCCASGRPPRSDASLLRRRAHRPRLAQSVDLRVAVAEAGEDFPRMLSECRRAERRRAGPDVNRPRESAVPSEARVLEAREDLRCFHLRVIEHVLHGAGGGAWNTIAE